MLHCPKNTTFSKPQKKISSPKIFHCFLLYGTTPGSGTMVRLKSRYILFEFLYPDGLFSGIPDTVDPTILRQPSAKSVDSRRVIKQIREVIKEYFGDYGAGVTASTLMLKYFSPVTSTGILRVSRDYFNLVWAALSMIDDIQGRPVIVRVARVSGTIKKCEQAAIARDKTLVNEVEKGTSLQRFLSGASTSDNEMENDEGIYDD